MSKFSRLYSAAVAIGIFGITGAGSAMANIALNEATAVQAGVISKAQAISIALHAVGNGSVVSALLEKEDNGFVHWSIDIRGKANDFEVWVGIRGKVLRIVTQPL